MQHCKIIINADDCGYSPHVNHHIEQAIINKRISSTTIMANMNDFDGAIELYKKYNDRISYGLHINLTEGTPLLYSEKLLAIGFYKLEAGILKFNSQPYRRRFLSSSIRAEIYKEVLAQAKKVQEAGVNLSHIDSHHFIHQAVFMIPILPKLCKELGVKKVRNYRNYMPFSINRLLRNCWSASICLQNKRVLFSDWFTSYEDFYSKYKTGTKYYKENDVIELMCHPGGKYEEEEYLLMRESPEQLYNCLLIDYNTFEK